MKPLIFGVAVAALACAALAETYAAKDSPHVMQAAHMSILTPLVSGDERDGEGSNAALRREVRSPNAGRLVAMPFSALTFENRDHLDSHRVRLDALLLGRQ